MRGPGVILPARLRATGAAALLAFAAFLALSPRAAALGPHEVALLVNDASPDSAALAAAWADLRGVPAANIVRVSVPCGTNGIPSVAISKSDFESLIWEPANAALKAAGVERNILVWVYSCGFPARIADSPASLVSPSTNDLSITGATFLRARWPEDPAAAITRAGYVSPLFIGPSMAGEEAGPSRAFDQSRNDLLDAMPLPAAMLSWTGPRGLSLDASIAALRRSAEADVAAAGPTGLLAWFRRRPGDPRSDAREWQFEAAASALAARGVRTVVSTNAPAAGDGPLAHYLDGAREVSPLPALAPGAFADHFTSFSCAFDRPTQMKATRWLAAGAGFTSGAVAEPFSIWAKFPGADLFIRRLDGLSAIEALYASVRCPLQLLPLGDPLSNPWSPRIEPAIEGLPEPGSPPVSEALVLRAALPAAAPAGGVRHTWLVDGRQAGTGPLFVWNAASAAPGPHELRLVTRALAENGVRLQGTAIATMEVAGD